VLRWRLAIVWSFVMVNPDNIKVRARMNLPDLDGLRGASPNQPRRTGRRRTMSRAAARPDDDGGVRRVHR
jgi:hypothetical protein